MAPTELLSGPETIQPWLASLVRRSKHSGCHHILFPVSPPPPTSCSSSPHPHHHHHHHSHHLQGLQARLQKDTAGRLVRESLAGPIWAYMLTLVVHADELFADPALAVRLARVAAARAPDAPVTDRDWCRLRFELDGACPEDYPSRAHYEQGRRWLETVVRRHRPGAGAGVGEGF